MTHRHLPALLLATALALPAVPAVADITPPASGLNTNAANAVLPDGRTNLELGTASNPAFAGLALGGALQGTNILSLAGSTGHLGYFLQSPATPTQAGYANLRLDRNSSYVGGSPVGTVQSLWALSNTSVNGAYYEWPITSQMYNQTLGSTGAQNVAINGTAFKRFFSLPVNISNASPAVVSQTSATQVTTENVITFTTTGTLPAPLAVATPYYVLAAGLTANSFRISATLNGAAINTTTNGSGVHTFTVSGQLGPTWGGNFVCHDLTATVDPTSSCIGVEISSYTTAGAGTDANRQRVGLQIATGGSQAGDHVGYGILMGPGGSTTLDRAIYMSGATGTIGIGIDLSNPVFTTAAILGSAAQQTAIKWLDTGGVLDATHGFALSAGNDNNLYFDNHSNTTTAFRGPGGAPRLSLSSTAAVLSGSVQFTDGVGTLTSSNNPGQNKYTTTASGNWDLNFNGNGALQITSGYGTYLSVGGSSLKTTFGGAVQHNGATSGSVTLAVPAVAGTNTITLPAGTTDFSATGGTSQVVKQTSAGGAFTVAQLANTDITGLGTMSTQNASAVAITGGTASGVTLTDTINQGFVVATSTLTKSTDTALATVPGLSIALTAGKTYNCKGHLTGTAGASGGLKVALVATDSLSATSASFTGFSWNGTTVGTNTTVTALGSNIVANTAIYSDVYIDGAIVVNAGGTINVQAAQNVSNGTATTVLLNSTFSCVRVS